MPEPMIVYKWDFETPRPIPVECETPGFPNRDADGDTMYVNTHYATEEEAWGSLVEDRKAGLSLSTRSMRELQRRLKAETEAVAEAAAQFVEVEANYQNWLAEREEGSGG